MKTGNYKDVNGYIFNSEGMHSGPISLKWEPVTISSFIMKSCMASGKILITNMFDMPLLETIPGSFFLDYVDDKEFLSKELLPVLIPMQSGEVEIPSLEAIYVEEGSGYSNEEAREFINKNFGTSL